MTRPGLPRIEPNALGDVKRAAVLRDYLAGKIFTSFNIRLELVPDVLARVFPITEVLGIEARKRALELGMTTAAFEFVFAGAFEYLSRAEFGIELIDPVTDKRLPVFSSCVLVGRADWQWLMDHVRHARGLTPHRRTNPTNVN